MLISLIKLKTAVSRIRHGGVKFHKKDELWPTFPKMLLGHPEVVLQSLDQLDTRLNHYGLISSQSMLIYHLNLKTAVSRKRLIGSQK